MKIIITEAATEFYTNLHLGTNAYAKIGINWELFNFDTTWQNVNGSLYQIKINRGY